MKNQRSTNSEILQTGPFQHALWNHLQSHVHNERQRLQAMVLYAILME